MIKVIVYKVNEEIATVSCDERDELTISEKPNHKGFINSLKSEDDISNREFVRSLPERLNSYINARIAQDD